MCLVSHLWHSAVISAFSKRMNETPTHWQPWPTQHRFLLFPKRGVRASGCRETRHAAVYLHIPHQFLLAPSLQANCARAAKELKSFIGAERLLAFCSGSEWMFYRTGLFSSLPVQEVLKAAVWCVRTNKRAASVCLCAAAKLEKKSVILDHCYYGICVKML